MKVFQSFLLSFLFLVCSISHATVIIYDEAADGDLSFDTFSETSPNFIGTLGIGQNIIKGSSSVVAPSDVDTDFFHFSINQGHELISITISENATEAMSLFKADAIRELRVSFDDLLTTDDALFSFRTNIFNSNTPGIPPPVYPNPLNEIFTPGLGEGDYSILGFGWAFSISQSNPNDLIRVAWNYTVTLEVVPVSVPVPVPFPDTACLFLSICVGLIGFQKSGIRKL